MTSVWFAASGSGEDGDEYDVHEVFATEADARAHCDRPDRPSWEHHYVQEWEVTGSLLTDEEREAVEWAAEAYERRYQERVGLENNGPDQCGEIAGTLRKLLERLA